MSAYWIAHVTIHDMEQYKQYIVLLRKLFKSMVPSFLRVAVPRKS